MTPSQGGRPVARAALPPFAVVALILAYHMNTSTARHTPPTPARLLDHLRSSAANTASSALSAGRAAVVHHTASVNFSSKKEDKNGINESIDNPGNVLTDDHAPGMLNTEIRSSSSPTSFLSTVRVAFFPLLLCYSAGFAFFAWSQRAQGWLIYLHWLKPPILYPLTDLRAYKLAGVGRNVRAAHLRGWHLLPPGPPFAPPLQCAVADAGNNNNRNNISSRNGMTSSESANSIGDMDTSIMGLNDVTSQQDHGDVEDETREAFFDSRLAAPRQTVVLFLHGNSGTRAFPSKRVDAIKLLNTQLEAHVVTFDYSGFGDSPGRPHEAGLGADARTMLHWILQRVAADTTVLVYGQSLGSFAAVDAVMSIPSRSLSQGHLHTTEVPLFSGACKRNEVEGTGGVGGGTGAGGAGIGAGVVSGMSAIGGTGNNDNINKGSVNEIGIGIVSHETMNRSSLRNTGNGGGSGGRATVARGADGLILDAAPASLVAAAMTHPVAGMFRVLPRRRMEALFRSLLRERLESKEKIADVRIPILLLHGRRDRMISVEQGRTLARRAREAGNPLVELHEFEDCGHVDVSSSPDYLRIVHSFISRVRRSA